MIYILINNDYINYFKDVIILSYELIIIDFVLYIIYFNLLLLFLFNYIFYYNIESFIGVSLEIIKKNC